jgi:rod shape-determining protein MreD
MSLAVAIVGAVVAALLETSVAPYLQVGGFTPDLVLITATVCTVTVNAEAGFVWAFVGGLMLDMVMAPARPTGGTVLALLACMGLAALAARFVGRNPVLTAVVAVFLLTFVFRLLLAVILSATVGGISIIDPLRTLLPVAIENTVIAVPLAFAFRWTWLRFGVHDRIEW